MSSEDSRVEQIGTQKCVLSALLIEGIYASRSQNSVEKKSLKLVFFYIETLPSQLAVDLETESMADRKNMSILLYFYWKLSNE